MTLQPVKKRPVEKWFNRVMVRIKASRNWDMMMTNKSFKWKSWKRQFAL